MAAQNGEVSTGLRHLVNPMVTPFRTRSSSGRSSATIGHSCPLPYSSGDGAIPVTAAVVRSRIHVPPSNNGISTIFDNTDSFQVRRRSSQVEQSFTPTYRNMDDTPIHSMSKEVLSGIGRMISSEAVRNTASKIFTGAFNVGSKLISSGIQLASVLFSEIDPPEDPREDEIMCKGCVIKTFGNGVTVQSLHIDGQGFKVLIKLGPNLTAPSPVYDEAKLTLTFQSYNVIVVLPPPETNPGGINWVGPDDERIFTLHVQ